MTWNVVPWYIGDGAKIRGAKSADLDDARSATRELLSLLPRVQVAVLLGKTASRAWALLGINLPSIEAPHPSPLSLNTNSARRQQIRDALTAALRASSPQAR